MAEHAPGDVLIAGERSEKKDYKLGITPALLAIAQTGGLVLDLVERRAGRAATLVDKGDISGKIAKTVFDEMVATGKDPETVIQERGLVQLSDAGALEAQAREIIAVHPKEAADFKAGKTKVLGFFVGQLMKKTQGQANPQLANEIFQRLLQ